MRRASVNAIHSAVVGKSDDVEIHHHHHYNKSMHGASLWPTGLSQLTTSDSSDYSRHPRNSQIPPSPPKKLPNMVCRNLGPPLKMKQSIFVTKRRMTMEKLSYSLIYSWIN